MKVIVNRIEPITFYSNFPALNLSRLKFLTKLLNFLLRKLGAYEECKKNQITQVEIDLDSCYKAVNVVLQHELRYGRNIKCLLIGYDTFYKFTTESEFLLSRPCLMLDYEIMGIKVVLHPTVQGIIPLDFAP